MRLTCAVRRWWAAALLLNADGAARLAGAEGAALLAASQGRLATLRQRQERAEGEGARAGRVREEEAARQLQLARRRLLAEQARRRWRAKVEWGAGDRMLRLQGTACLGCRGPHA